MPNDSTTPETGDTTPAAPPATLPFLDLEDGELLRRMKVIRKYAHTLGIAPTSPEGATINSDDEDVGQVAAALADATLAGGLSTAYHREADDALRRLWNRVHRAERALCMHLDCTAEELELGFEIGDPDDDDGLSSRDSDPAAGPS